MAEDKDDNVTNINADIDPDKAAEALQKGGQSRLVGYILSPESMAELLESCNDIPGRYYKRMAPRLMSASQLIETEDGKFNVISPNSG